MGSICLDRLEKLVPGGLGEVAIETGTCRGYGAKALAVAFPKVITIELSEALHMAAREKLVDLPNVICLLGNSAEVLPRVLSEVPGETGVFFFLDAHWSGDHTVPWDRSKWKGYGHDTAHLGRAGEKPTGPEQCPLALELRNITEFCRGPAAILIDDVKNIGQRDSGFPGEDWTHLSQESLLAIVESRLEEFRELEKPNQWFLRLRPISGTA